MGLAAERGGDGEAAPLSWATAGWWPKVVEVFRIGRTTAKSIKRRFMDAGEAARSA